MGRGPDNTDATECSCGLPSDVLPNLQPCCVLWGFTLVSGGGGCRCDQVAECRRLNRYVKESVYLIKDYKILPEIGLNSKKI